jgi:hypothetical protein
MSASSKPRKIFGLHWLFEAFEGHPGFIEKRMFGGIAAYLDELMVMVLMEDPGNRSYRDQTYSFDIWNGMCLPMDRENHQAAKALFPQLVNHPVLPKWLYLPMSAEEFEETAREIAERIARGDRLFGTVPPKKKKRSKKSEPVSGRAKKRTTPKKKSPRSKKKSAAVPTKSKRKSKKR